MIEQWNELKETIVEMRDNGGTGTQQEVCGFLANLMDVLENQMIGLESTNKCGEWLDNGFCGDCVCSVCKHEFDYDIANMRGFNFALPKFCPNCGAKMQEVKNDNT